MAAVLRPSGVAVLASYICFNFFSVLAVVLRFVSIRIRRRQIKAHDYFCVLALLCSIAYSIDTLIGTVNGEIGVHIEEAAKNPDRLIVTLKTFFASEWFWATGVCSFRISMLLLYCDIFPHQRFRWAAFASIAVVGAFWLGSVITILLSCRPLQKNWDSTIPGKCENIGVAELAAAAINMVLDIIIVALPLPIIWRLQMTIEKKLGVSVIFALGISIAGINLARIIKVLDCNINDFTYCTRDSAILTVAETATGVIVACCPTLGVVLFPGRVGPASAAKYAARRALDDSKDSGIPLPRRRFANLDTSDDEIYTGSQIKSSVTVEYSDAREFRSTKMDGVGVRKDIDVTAEDV